MEIMVVAQEYPRSAVQDVSFIAFFENLGHLAYIKLKTRRLYFQAGSY